MSRLATALVWVTLAASASPAQEDRTTEQPRFTVYGRVQADGGNDFGAINPDYFDRLRPSQLPDSANEFGRNGRVYFSVRQTRLGLKTHIPSEIGEILTIIEFDLIGTGSQAGLTTPRLRLAYGELNGFGAGQFWSPFSDTAARPPIFESMGPTGQPWVRNIQFRWMPMRGATQLTFAIERPNASGEGGDYEQVVQLQNVQLRSRTPEWTNAIQRDWHWGHARVATLLRKVWWDDLNEDTLDLAGHATGWGVTVSSVYRFGGTKHTKDALKLQYLVGEGVENYIDDNTADVAPEVTANLTRPLIGVALPVQTFTGYVEVYRGKWGGVAGYSMQDIDNSNGQSADAFAGSSYYTITAIYYPTAKVLAGLEYQYGRRRNFTDDWRFTDQRMQFTVRWSFSADFRPQ